MCTWARPRKAVRCGERFLSKKWQTAWFVCMIKLHGGNWLVRVEYNMNLTVMSMTALARKSSCFFVNDSFVNIDNEDEDGDDDVDDDKKEDDDDNNEDDSDNDNLQVRLELSSPFHDESRLLAPDQLLGREQRAAIRIVIIIIGENHFK